MQRKNEAAKEMTMWNDKNSLLHHLNNGKIKVGFARIIKNVKRKLLKYKRPFPETGKGLLCMNNL